MTETKLVYVKMVYSSEVTMRWVYNCSMFAMTPGKRGWTEAFLSSKMKKVCELVSFGFILTLCRA